MIDEELVVIPSAEAGGHHGVSLVDRERRRGHGGQRGGLGDHGGGSKATRDLGRGMTTTSHNDRRQGT